MGSFSSRLTRPIRTFNVEYRAHKVIEKAKPTPAPSYPSIEKQMKIVNEINPNFMEMHNKKDPQLDDNLKKVFVSSHIKYESGGDSSEKELPHSRTTDPDFDFGFWEPESSSEGKTRFRDILQFMTDNINDPEKYSPQNIALKYKLDVKDVENILEYYRVFAVVIPNDKNLKNMRVATSNIKGVIENK